jgi:adenylate cyclase
LRLELRRLMLFETFRAIMQAMTEKVKRRLTTVLCADVQGYSRLMEADEAGTLATLRRYRTAMAALIERHDGRIVNTWGDAVIAEFASVVEAVQCAIEIQQELSAQDPHLPEAQRMRFRIGINLGDVMVDGSDIYGEGVNIAARLQELAEPGGILISGPVYDQVHNKLSVGFDYLGQQQVKNIAAPVMSYRVTGTGTAVGRPGTQMAEKAAPKASTGTVNETGAPAHPDKRGLTGGASRLGSVCGPAAPHRGDHRHRGLSVSDQRFQWSRQHLVSLAGCIPVVDRRPVGGVPA